MEFITDITLIVDTAAHADPERSVRILSSYSCERKGSCYRVSGTYEQLERLTNRLSARKDRVSSAARGRTRPPDEHASGHVRPVDVSGVVMAYIQRKCAKQLKNIQGNRFVYEIRPDLRAVHSDPHSTLQVTFKPRDASVRRVHVDFVRQRFITFYQRTAADLQVTSVPVRPQDSKRLQTRFPQLLFEEGRGKNEATVTGPFAHVAKLGELLSGKTPSSSEGAGSGGPGDTPSSRTPGPQPTYGSRGPEDETCPICMEPIAAAAERRTLRCKHSFCGGCLKQAFHYKPVCPTCGELYGTLTGTQPDGGRMTHTRSSSSLPGYEKYGTIVIQYSIPSGIQKEEHPNPGQPYEGVVRAAYLPDSSEGRRILELLSRAFAQRLVFTVGRSTTTGRNNAVTWNDIHHKTSTRGGPTNYGYPDPEYLSRVRDELKVKGIE